MPRETKAKEKAAGTGTQSARLTKTRAGQYLAKVPKENAFWCHDGTVLRDMQELKDALSMMSDETFKYHSNEMKRDFSNWVRDIVGDTKLARDLERSGDRQQALKAVEDRCSILASKAEGLEK